MASDASLRRGQFMNGYELADEIKTMLADAESYYGEAESYLIKCETMLRQQQAEIEALKAGKIKAYDNGYEDGRKPNTNNEPVAWMLKTGHGTKILEKKPYCQVDLWQGLYTQNQLNEAVLLERESCAKLCESSSERDKITALIGSGYAHNIRNRK